MDSCLRASLLATLGRPLDASDAAKSLAGHLAGMRRALLEDRIDDALRHVDRAWRCEPAASDLLAGVYARVLCLASRDPDAVLPLLRRSLARRPDPEEAALYAFTLRRLGRPEDARLALQDALAAYCVMPAGLLARVAGILARDPAWAVPGWVGLGPRLELVGEHLAPGAALEIRGDGNGGSAVVTATPDASNDPAIHRVLPALARGARIEVLAAGVPLVGSGLQRPTDFRLDGRISESGGQFRVWARLGWAPALAPVLRVANERGGNAAIATRVADPGYRWQLRLDRRAAPLRGQRIEVAVCLPDGDWQAMPDSPMLREPAVRLGRRAPRLPAWGAPLAAPRRRAARAPSRLVDVIIPVYGDRVAALACIDSVLATTGGRDRRGARILVVDDASPDEALRQALDALAADRRIELVRNRENLGFVGSANRGLALHPDRDALLLNADTRVFGDWLSRLRAAAYAASDVGSATPFSNNGSIASYPERLGRNPAERAGVEYGSAIDVPAAAALQALVARVHGGVSAEIPVGVGFCLYLRRDCLKDVGALDAAVFGKGYGEETDFCLRAARRGWKHRLAADVYVYHAGGASFGARRAALLARSQPLLNLRHPGFDRYVDSFLTADPLRSLRRHLDATRLLGSDARRVLIVGVAMLGGVRRYVRERCRSLRADGIMPVVLRAAGPADLRHVELVSDELDLPNLRYSIPGELAELKALLESLGVEAIEFQHFLHLDARVVETLRALGVPYDVVVHDYAWICPRVTLIDATQSYCGEPAVAVCERCLRRNGSELGERSSVAELRARSARWLGGARHVFAPSADAAARLVRYFPELAIIVRPHSFPPIAAAARAHAPRRAAGAPVRVALLGAIGAHKGYRVLLACARDARTRQLPIEFVVIGYSEDDAPLLATGKVFITGAYGDVEVPDLLRREAADLLWLPSVWPETWSYVLDHALASAVPIVAFDLGAIAERLRGAGRGELLPLSLTPPAINDRLLGFAGYHREKASKSQSGQAKLLRSAGPATMEVSLLKSSPMHHKSSPKPTAITPPSPVPAPATAAADRALAASVQVLPMPAGFYLFSVTTAAPGTAHGDAMSLPALHVSVGPGVPATQVEFVAGQTDRGNWLFAAEDLLVAKVKGAGVTLVLTSVRAADGRALAIKVERLGASATSLAEAVAQPAAAVAAPNAATATAPPRPANGAHPVPVAARAESARVAGRIPLQVSAHISTRGDVSFTDPDWVGRLAPGQWIESFAVEPLERLAARDLEYKGLTGSGFETPWISDGKICGTKAMATPLIGFALRFRPSAATVAYDCEYSGYFKSGIIVGPLRNGAPCRSTVANDPLEGLRVQIVQRAGAATKAAGQAAAKPRATEKSAPRRKPGRNGKRRPVSRGT
jgi:GT2 family glycosyltransferase/glycosyltransferase involved in cell wall biosynthesis